MFFSPTTLTTPDALVSAIFMRVPGLSFTYLKSVTITAVYLPPVFLLYQVKLILEQLNTYFFFSDSLLNDNTRYPESITYQP